MEQTHRLIDQGLYRDYQQNIYGHILCQQARPFISAACDSFYHQTHPSSYQGCACVRIHDIASARTMAYFQRMRLAVV